MMFFFHSRPLGRILECQWILLPYGTINFCFCYCHECERVKNSFQFCTILECWLHWNLKFIHSPQMDRGDCLRTLGKMWEAFMLFSLYPRTRGNCWELWDFFYDLFDFNWRWMQNFFLSTALAFICFSSFSVALSLGKFSSVATVS